jgi:hypothetical protein
MLLRCIHKLGEISTYLKTDGDDGVICGCVVAVVVGVLDSPIPASVAANRSTPVPLLSVANTV